MRVSSNAVTTDHVGADGPDQATALMNQISQEGVGACDQFALLALVIMMVAE
jgi:hypothetical protein